MECPHITQGQTVSLTLKDLTSKIKSGVRCGGKFNMIMNTFPVI